MRKLLTLLLVFVAICGLSAVNCLASNPTLSRPDTIALQADDTNSADEAGEEQGDANDAGDQEDSDANDTETGQQEEAPQE